MDRYGLLLDLNLLPGCCLISISYSIFLEARDILRDFREENVRKSDVVVKLWERVLRSKNSKLGDERK